MEPNLANMIIVKRKFRVLQWGGRRPQIGRNLVNLKKKSFYEPSVEMLQYLHVHVINLLAA